jgi:FkbM family methyltransferase
VVVTHAPKWLGHITGTGIPANTRIGLNACLPGLASRGYTPECILDIGAAAVHWTKEALWVWPKARYFLFEPLSERQAGLEKLRRLHPNVDYILAGAADGPERLSLGVYPDRLDESSFCYGGTENRTVNTVTVDDLMRQSRFPQPQFIKIDVQGFEIKVLTGAAAAMVACDPILMEMQLAENLIYRYNWHFALLQARTLVVVVLRRHRLLRDGRC